MKYFTTATISSSWTRIIREGQVHRSQLNKFFGILEILKCIDNTTNGHIQSNFVYRLVARELSNGLQLKYYFGEEVREFNSEENLNIVFSSQWNTVALASFLKNSQMSIGDVAVVCLQNEQFEDDVTLGAVVSKFVDQYKLGDFVTELFSNNHPEVAFTEDPPSRTEVFRLLQEEFQFIVDSKYTFGFDGVNISANPGELTRGPFIQPLYAGQENLKCLLLTNFAINDYYNINPKTTLEALQSNDTLPRNKIIYGAPGTGKSYELRDQAGLAGFSEDDIIRVTFHPNYSYQQFVGSYKPTPIYRNVLQEGAVFYGSDKTTELENNHKKEPLIDYRFVAGPLMKQLVFALNNPNKNYLLIIEEINRASVSSVFGDVFQLLDRKEDGTSEYNITFNEEAMAFLRLNSIYDSEIHLPSNLFIWATMNSADQGVMPLDAAFKRRWTFEYLPLNAKQEKVADRKIKFQGQEYAWNSFRKQINDTLKDLGVVEDKLIGPFFMNSNELSNENSIKNKLLLYLRDDVVRHNPESLFIKKTYSDIIEMYSKGENIFVNLEIKNELTEETEVSD